MGSRPYFTGIISVLICMWLALPAAAACRDDTVELRGDWGQARFSVDLAQTAAERSQGLMFVENMPASRGMLFIYPDEQPVAFWMQNTLIPLDMIFADATGLIHKVHSNAIPGDTTAIDGGTSRFVLEINGGLAQAIGLTAGSELRHPSVPRDGAVWPCD